MSTVGYKQQQGTLTCVVQVVSQEDLTCAEWGCRSEAQSAHADCSAGVTLGKQHIQNRGFAIYLSNH